MNSNCKIVFQFIIWPIKAEFRGCYNRALKLTRYQVLFKLFEISAGLKHLLTNAQLDKIKCDKISCSYRKLFLYLKLLVYYFNWSFVTDRFDYGFKIYSKRTFKNKNHC
jgi:hypothetical protein